MKEQFILLGIDYADLVVRLGNSEVMAEKFLKNFLSDTTIETIKKSYQSGDHEQLMHSVHTLKGISANLSMCKLFQICSEWMQDLRCNNYDNNGESYRKCIQEYMKIANGLRTIFGEA